MYAGIFHTDQFTGISAMGSPFPAEWQVFHHREYATFGGADAADPGVSVHVLLPLDPAHNNNGEYRICLSGDELISARVPLPAVAPDLLAPFNTYYLEFEYHPTDVSPEPNTTVTPWRDLADLIRSRDVFVSDDTAQRLEPEPVLHLLGADRPAAVRWAVAIDAEGYLQLELQTLPATAKYLNKAAFKGANSVSCLLHHVPLQVLFFDGEHADGPVPLFFSSFPDTARTYLQHNDSAVRAVVLRINSQFLRMEHLELSAAITYLSKRHRAAKGVAVYAGVEPPAKRPRTSPPENTDSGIIYFVNLIFLSTLFPHIFIFI